MSSMLPEHHASLTKLSRPRKVVIVAAQFAPSNLTAGHRTRLFVRHLPEFGYEPIVLSVDPRYYEEQLDPELEAMLPQGLRVERTAALPIGPIRIVGDIALRAMWHHARRLDQLAREECFDLLYIPIPPFYAGLLGPRVKRRHGIPYVIDYIDPWVHPITEQSRRTLRGRLAHQLANWLEPRSLRTAEGITGVASSYYADAIDRNPHLRNVPDAGIPYGGEPEDHRWVEQTNRRSDVLDRLKLGNRHVLVYAGAVLPTAIETIRTLFASCNQLRSEMPDLAERLHLVFVGTGLRVNDPTSGVIASLAEATGAGDLVTEVAQRQPYLEVLSLLHQSQGVMVLGSREVHYTPSKAFQAIYSQRPILALVHEASTAVGYLQDQSQVELICFSNEYPVEQKTAQIVGALRRLLQLPRDTIAQRNPTHLESVSARSMTRQLAELFDRVLARQSPPATT